MKETISNRACELSAANPLSVGKNIDMAIQLKLITIPIEQVEAENEALNKFLRAHKIVEIEKQLVAFRHGHSWCFCISYIENQAPTRSRKKINYMEVLGAPTFAIFSKLRQIRKQIAVQDAVSAYIVFTDAELAQIAQLEELNLAQLKKIKGIGEKKAANYGTRLLTLYQNQHHETSG